MLEIPASKFTLGFQNLRKYLLGKHSKLFNATNPFDFMESISIEGKTNFFEARPTQYQNASILNKSRESSFVINSDF